MAAHLAGLLGKRGVVFHRDMHRLDIAWRMLGEGRRGGYAAAKAHCPTDTIVWVNTKSGIYHFAGTHNYGTTKSGSYMCGAEAKAAGDRAAENKKHP